MQYIIVPLLLLEILGIMTGPNGELRAPSDTKTADGRRCYDGHLVSGDVSQPAIDIGSLA